MSSNGAAADEASKRLRAAGFQKLSERNSWKGLKTGGKYYFTRNASTIVAFAIGSKYAAGNGFHMIGAHTDRYMINLISVHKHFWQLILHASVHATCPALAANHAPAQNATACLPACHAKPSPLCIR